MLYCFDAKAVGNANTLCRAFSFTFADVGSVVQQLLSNINSKMSKCDPAFRRPLQTLMQVIRGLL